jgi:hypothetical protein
MDTRTFHATHDTRKETHDTRECSICYLEFSSEKIKGCVKCGFECCEECWKKYIIEGLCSGLDPESAVVCMNCKNSFTKKFLLDIGGRVWVTRDLKNTYKSFLKNIYAEKEKAKIPETIIYIEEYTKKEKTRKKIMELMKVVSNDIEYNKKQKLVSKELREVLGFIIDKYKTMYPQEELFSYRIFLEIFRNYPNLNLDTLERYHYGVPDNLIPFFTEEFEKTPRNVKIMNIIKNIKASEEYKRGEEIEKQIQQLRNKLWPRNSKEKIQDKLPTIQFIQGCPFDDCRGLIDSKKFKCSICSGKICKKCRISISRDNLVEKTEDKPQKYRHVCKPEDIESVKLIKQDSKVCPKCSTNIFRISGCTQIWCTQCHIAFDWNTGKIETGTIHNPHYIEFIKNRGMTIHDNNECGDDIPHQICIYDRLATPHFIEKKLPLTYILIDYHVISMIRYLIRDSLPQFIRMCDRRISEDYEDPQSFAFRLRNYRVKYIQNKITEKEWKKRVYEIYKQIELEKFYIEVFNSLRMVLMESYKKLYIDLGEPQHSISNKKLYDKYVEEKTNVHDIFINYVEDARNYFNETIILEHSLYSSTMDFMFIGPRWDIMKYIDYKKHGFQRPPDTKGDLGQEKTYHLSSHNNPQIRTRIIDAREEEIYITSDDEDYFDEILEEFNNLDIVGESSSKGKEEDYEVGEEFILEEDD